MPLQLFWTLRVKFCLGTSAKERLAVQADSHAAQQQTHVEVLQTHVELLKSKLCTERAENAQLLIQILDLENKNTLQGLFGKSSALNSQTRKGF